MATYVCANIGSCYGSCMMTSSHITLTNVIINRNFSVAFTWEQFPRKYSWKMSVNMLNVRFTAESRLDHDGSPDSKVHGPTWGPPGSWGQHGTHLGPVGPRLAPCWPHESCYQGRLRWWLPCWIVNWYQGSNQGTLFITLVDISSFVQQLGRYWHFATYVIGTGG